MLLKFVIGICVVLSLGVLEAKISKKAPLKIAMLQFDPIAGGHWK